MDIFMKILGTLIGLAFMFVGIRFLFFPNAVIKGIQKYKFKTTSTPRKQEITISRIIGAFITLVGLYFTLYAVSSFF